MKKTLLLVFLLFLTSYKAACQYSYGYEKRETNEDTVKQAFIQYHVITGLNSTSIARGKISSHDFGFNELKPKLEPIIGISADYIPLKYNEHGQQLLSCWSIYFTLLFQRHSFENVVSWYPDGKNLFFQDYYKIDMYYSQLTSAAKYQFKRKHFNFFVTAGCSLNYVFDRKTYLHEYRYYDGNGNYTNGGRTPLNGGIYLRDFERFELDILASIGATYHRFNFELRYKTSIDRAVTNLGLNARIDYFYLLFAYQINNFK
jgi:hypothetical protein